jgi:hypothetical protein
MDLCQKQGLFQLISYNWAIERKDQGSIIIIDDSPGEIGRTAKDQIENLFWLFIAIGRWYFNWKIFFFTVRDFWIGQEALKKVP